MRARLLPPSHATAHHRASRPLTTLAGGRGVALATLLTGALAVSFLATGVAAAQGRPTVPASRLAAAPGAAAASGKVEVVVKLADAPLAVALGQAAKQRGAALSRSQAQAHLQTLASRQAGVMNQARALGAVELARVSRSLNAVVMSIEPGRVAALERIPGVVSVRAVKTYTRDLSATVPYIGAATAQAAGKDGTGVRVAVLDSGVDFTHRNLGGPGTLASYDECYTQRSTAPSGSCANLFGPSAPKVVGGFDFVGDLWPNADRSEDPNPIDRQGHGTHVADIIAGRSADGVHKGVAPGAKIFAIKVCSTVSTSCNGVALLKGMDFALDPNGDGDLSDAVDIINMSLGSSYGQSQDDLSEASANAVRYGVVVVASAGNSADRPYIVGSPSSTPEVISVAQTQVPGGLTYPLVVTGISPSTITNIATVEWAPIGSGFSAPVVRLGRGCPGDAYFNGNSPAGKVALIDRGTCAVSLKVDLATKAGAAGVIIANNADGDAPSFSFGGGDLPMAPTLVIAKADGDRIKTALGGAGVNSAVVATLAPANALSLAGSMVATSSRGPNISQNIIKPDIGAPGASVSAIAGTGDGTEAFGGTSGAAPMVSGAAALLVQAFPTRSPVEIKAALMNSAEKTIYTNPATQPGVLAPVTRIGAGEVRVDRALDSTLAAWDTKDPTGSLSFGYLSATDKRTLTRKVTVRNYAAGTRRLSISAGFRFPADEASGAVSLRAPSSVSVPGNGSASFDLQLRIDPSKLPAWTMNGGSQGGNGPLLQSVEFDGHLTLSDSQGSISLPWHLLPQKSSDVEASSSAVAAGGSLTLSNKGAAPATVSVFSLTGSSVRLPVSSYPDAGDNYAVIDLKSVGVRAVGNNLQFAIHTYGERAHPNYPAEFDVYIDTNGDGLPDYVAYNAENGGFAATGQNLVNLYNLNTGTSAAYFYTGADLNSANAVLTVPFSAMGITAATPIAFSVYAFDNYFTGNLTDAIENMRYTPGTPRYAATDVVVPAGGSTALPVQAVNGGSAASPSQSGLLLFFSDGRRKNEALAIGVTP